MKQIFKLLDVNQITGIVRKWYKHISWVCLKLLPLILVSVFLTPKIVFAFAIGAVNGLTCGSLAKPVPCKVADLGTKMNWFYEEVHQNITAEALSGLTYKSISIDNAILEDIKIANKNIDYDQSLVGAFKHCDDELIGPCMRRVYDIYWSLIDALQNPSVISKKQASDLRLQFGGALHTLQDFFAHTNWVNAAATFPSNISSTFWKLSECCDLQPLMADKACQQHSGAVSVSNYSIFRNYPPETGELIFFTGGNLTSGFAWESLNAAEAPSNKCAHGLVGNGIHKDWSGRDFHPEAKQAAVAATKQFANDLISNNGNNPDNVCMFLTNKPCGVRVTVVATTGSAGKGTVTSNPTGISCKTGSDQNCSSSFPASGNVTLTANPDSGNIVSSWSGDCTSQSIASDGSSGACTVAMDGSPKNVTATFNSNVNVVGSYHLIKYKPNYDYSCYSIYPPYGYIPVGGIPSCLKSASHLNYDLLAFESGSFMYINADGTFLIKTWFTYINEGIISGQNSDPYTGVWSSNGNNLYFTIIFPNGYRYTYSGWYEINNNNVFIYNNADTVSYDLLFQKD